MKEFFVKNKYLILIFIFAIANIFVSYFYIGYKPELVKDASEYFEAARFLQGDQVGGQIQLGRILTTPLFLYTSILINNLFNDFSLSFSVVNIIFYLLLAFAFYFLALEIYKEQKIAFFSSIFVIFNYYIIDPSNAHLADMGSWFFFIVSTIFAVKYINTVDRKYYGLSIIFAAIGVFFKEYAGLALGNLILLICISDIYWKQKIKDILISIFLVLFPLLSFHIFIYLKYNYLYFDRFLSVGMISSAPGFESGGLILLIKILGWLFSFGWIAFGLGSLEEFKVGDKKRSKILLAILPVTLTFYIWPAITQRLAVMFMMWLSLIAGFGLSRSKWYLAYPFLGVYIWFNYNVLFLIDKINLPF